MKNNPLATAINRAASGASQGVAGTPKGSQVPPSRQGKKAVVFYVEPEIAKRLKLLSVEHDTTIEALGTEALGLLFARYDGRGGPPPRPPKRADGPLWCLSDDFWVVIPLGFSGARRRGWDS